MLAWLGVLLFILFLGDMLVQFYVGTYRREEGTSEVIEIFVELSVTGFLSNDKGEYYELTFW